MIDELLLLSGNDLPFNEAGLVIHQPKLREIAYITEESFWPAYEFLKFNKDSLDRQDKKGLSNWSNFNIIMSMMQEKNAQAKKTKNNVFLLLTILFPEYKISLTKDIIRLQHYETTEIKEINNDNFQKFKQILIDIFGFNQKVEEQYNPSGGLAKKIADKIKKGRQQRAKLTSESKISILSRYASILAVGTGNSINVFMDYTVYQLMDEFSRYNLKNHYDIWLQAKIAGASGMEQPEDWLKDIHTNN